MSITFANKAQSSAPVAADGVILTSSGVAWGNPAAFTTVLASISGASILSGVVIRPTFASGSNDWDNEIDIATGGVGSEVVISTIRFTYKDLFSIGSTCGSGHLPLPIGIDNIANNARISARMRSNTASAFTCALSILYLSKPISGQNTYLTTAQPVTSIPAATAGPTLTTPDGVFGNSAYVQIRAAAGNAVVLIAATFNGVAGYFEIDIATGTGGAEVVITTIHFRAENVETPCWFVFPNPLDNIAAATRIAARIRGNAVASLRFGLLAIEKPL